MFGWGWECYSDMSLHLTHGTKSEIFHWAAWKIHCFPGCVSLQGAALSLPCLGWVSESPGSGLVGQGVGGAVPIEQACWRTRVSRQTSESLKTSELSLLLLCSRKGALKPQLCLCGWARGCLAVLAQRCVQGREIQGEQGQDTEPCWASGTADAHGQAGTDGPA